MGLVGFQVGSWCSVSICCRVCELEKPFPTCSWWLEVQHGPKHGPRKPQKGTILRPKSGRIRFRIKFAGLQFPRRAYVDIGTPPLSFQELFCTCFWWFEGQHGPKPGPRRPQKGAILKPKSGRVRFRIGLAGLKFLRGAYVGRSDVLFGLQELICTCFWWFEGQHGPKPGPRSPQKGAILRPKSGRIGWRIGLAGLKFLSGAYVGRSDVFFGLQELICTCFWWFEGQHGPNMGPGGLKTVPF